MTYSIGIARHTVLRTGARAMFAFDKPFLKQYFTVAWPIMANELLWGGGTAVLNMIYGHMGTLEYTASRFATRWKTSLPPCSSRWPIPPTCWWARRSAGEERANPIRTRPAITLLDAGRCVAVWRGLDRSGSPVPVFFTRAAM